MAAAAFILLAYLIGSVSFAVLTSRAFGLPDPRTYGSHNPGATNVLRSGKKIAAVLTLLGDAAKGGFAVWLAQHYAAQFALNHAAVAAAALAAFLGHLFPVFFGFKGGKGVATALGILLALDAALGLAAAAIWLAAAAIWRISSLSALAAAICAPLLAALFLGWNVYALAVLAMALLLIWRHKANIRQLLAGSEDKINQATKES